MPETHFFMPSTRSACFTLLRCAYRSRKSIDMLGKEDRKTFSTVALVYKTPFGQLVVSV